MLCRAAKRIGQPHQNKKIQAPKGRWAARLRPCVQGRSLCLTIRSVGWKNLHQIAKIRPAAAPETSGFTKAKAPSDWERASFADQALFVDRPMFFLPCPSRRMG
jgi:hypothetical protein